MRNMDKFGERIRHWRKESCERHEEIHRLHMEHHKRQKELQRQQCELVKNLRASRMNADNDICDLQKEFEKKRRELEKQFKALQKSKRELHGMHRHARISPPIILIANLLIWYLVFRHTGLKVLSVFFAALFTLGGFAEFFFLRKLQSRILTPIHTLKKGLEEIAKGNYDVKVESGDHNQISLLIDSFNKMAQKLQESEKIKAEYEENRKALIVNISHDLKTPITSIQGYIEAITEENIPPETVNKYLKIIYNNTAYMNKLIDDLFLFSKLDMQKLEFEFVTVNAGPLINDMMEEFKLELEERNIQFEYTGNLEGELFFKIDRKRLHQVFRNIIGNAVKYGPENNLIIKAEAYLLNQSVYIDIRDNGQGIPKDKLPYIFDRFYRIDPERTKDFMSTGLGLAIAKELMEAHGGSITASSIENEGTCFTLILPIINDTDNEVVRP